MNAKAQAVVTPIRHNVRHGSHSPTNFAFHRVWPVACLAVALMTTVAWTALLGYGFFRLVF